MLGWRWGGTYSRFFLAFASLTTLRRYFLLNFVYRYYLLPLLKLVAQQTPQPLPNCVTQQSPQPLLHIGTLHVHPRAHPVVSRSKLNGPRTMLPRVRWRFQLELNLPAPLPTQSHQRHRMRYVRFWLRDTLTHADFRVLAQMPRCSKVFRSRNSRR